MLANNYLKLLLSSAKRVVVDLHQAQVLRQTRHASVLAARGFSPISGNIRYLADPQKLSMHGALRYAGGWHPFIEALRYGPAVLDEFYRRFQPRDFSEMYFLKKHNLNGENSPPWTLPWMPQGDSYAPTGEKGLSLAHGVSYYGPATTEKVVLEYHRLSTTVASIKEVGYNPEAHGDISGWFLECDGETIFFVRGGKHRAAALSFLFSERPIPIRVRDQDDSIVSLSDSYKWPMVASGELSQRVAEAAFRRYFEFDGRQHSETNIQ